MKRRATCACPANKQHTQDYVTSSTPKTTCIKIGQEEGQSTVEDVDEGSKRTKTDFTSLAYEAVSSDSTLL